MPHEQEPRPVNPYEGLSQEELDSVTAQFQEAQRELSREYMLVQDARLKLYAWGLRSKLDYQPETD